MRRATGGPTRAPSPDPRSLISLIAGRLIVQFEDLETARESLLGFVTMSAHDADLDLAGSVLALGFDGTGARLRP